MLTAMFLIKLGRFQGLSESSLGATATCCFFRVAPFNPFLDSTGGLISLTVVPPRDLCSCLLYNLYFEVYYHLLLAVLL